tara:strand:- start:203 stop:826 length:624 start_codon:yes stop_codon:yes gene_type:complete
MRTNKPILVLLFLGLGVALGLMLGLVPRDIPGEGSPALQTAEHQTIEWLDNPRSIERFNLESASSEFTEQSLQGHWTIMVFGFLHCPDVCPTSLSQLSVLADHLHENMTDLSINYVFVSVDPSRDAVADIDRYVQSFDSSFNGVTGSEAELHKLARNLGVRFKVSAKDEDYTVTHSTTFSIIDPEGYFRGRFRPGFDARALTSAFMP